MPETARVRVSDPGAMLTTIPLLMGFQPADGDTVLLGVGDTGRVISLARFDAGCARQITAPEVQAILASVRAAGVSSAFLIGYGKDVTPAIGRIRGLVSGQLPVCDSLRVEGNRYWSYQCHDLACCPAEGREFPAESAASTTLRAAGLTAASSRQDLADRIAGPTGDRAEAADRAWQQAAASPMTIAQGRQAVQAALAASYQGRQLGDDELARLAAAMRHLEVRDDAWARMTPDKADQHQALWADAVRRLPEKAAAAPATLLAWTAWQKGDGPLANLALDRAFAADPGYSMAALLQEALSAGLAPSHAVPPMTPEQVADSYRERRQVQADPENQPEA